MTRHEKLFEEYAKDLRNAKTRAEAWWKELHERTTEEMGSKKLADRELAERWPDGPASHPWVIAVIRKYWLACEALNQEIDAAEGAESPSETIELRYRLAGEDEEEADEEEDADVEEEVYPHVFVLEWLMTDEHDDLADFLVTLSNWPVGLDADDRYT
jgi:hypothetical protein